MIRKNAIILTITILTLFNISDISAQKTSASANTSYNRSLVYIGLSSQNDVSLEHLKKMNDILLQDMNKRLVRYLRFTDLSDAYLYSQNTDIPSIAKTRNVRWIVYGKTSKNALLTDAKPVVSIYLYDAVSAKDVESVTINVYENETNELKNNIEYIYSKIIETNAFFAAKPSAPAAKNAKAPGRFSARKVTLLDFEIDDKLPETFSRLTEITRKVIFERKQGSPDSASNEQMLLASMRSRNSHAMQRLQGIGAATGSKWIITGTLKPKPEDPAKTVCYINLIDMSKTAAVSSIEFTADSFEALAIVTRQRLENFLFMISAENNYSFHRTNEYRIMETHAKSITKNNSKIHNVFTGSVFDSSEILVSSYGNLTQFNKNGTISGTIEAEGTGLKKFTATAGVQLDQQGRIYIMDTVEKKIILFYKDGSFLNEFFYGTANADSFIVASGGYVFIPNVEKNIVQIYTKEGSHIKDAAFQGNSPYALFLSKGNPVLLSATDGLYTLTFFSQNGSVLNTRYLGIYTNSFTASAAAMDSNENLYCLDSSKEILLCISKTGTIMWIQKNLPGITADKLAQPSSVSVDYMGNNILVIDQKKQRLVTFIKKVESVPQKDKVLR